MVPEPREGMIKVEEEPRLPHCLQLFLQPFLNVLLKPVHDKIWRVLVGHVLQHKVPEIGLCRLRLLCLQLFVLCGHSCLGLCRCWHRRGRRSPGEAPWRWLLLRRRAADEAWIVRWTSPGAPWGPAPSARSLASASESTRKALAAPATGLTTFAASASALEAT